jgi:hypothetical protein
MKAGQSFGICAETLVCKRIHGNKSKQTKEHSTRKIYLQKEYILFNQKRCWNLTNKTQKKKKK